MTEKRSFWWEVFEWAQAILFAVIIAVVIRMFVFTLVLVEGPSMQPTLHSEDRLVVVKLLYKPKPGDIVVFTPEKMQPEKGPAVRYIKRVIAVGGQTIEVDAARNQVKVDGVVLDEPYIADGGIRSEGDFNYPVTVPEDCVFVMGDNRNNSKDSRVSDVGMVKNSTIVGHAVFRMWPFSDFGTIE